MEHRIRANPRSRPSEIPKVVARRVVPLGAPSESEKAKIEREARGTRWNLFPGISGGQSRRRRKKRDHSANKHAAGQSDERKHDPNVANQSGYAAAQAKAQGGSSRPYSAPLRRKATT